MAPRSIWTRSCIVAVVLLGGVSCSPGARDDAAVGATRSSPLTVALGKKVTGDGAAGDKFGNSVSADGTTVIVGAPQESLGGVTRAGAAYAYVRGAGGWSFQGKLLAKVAVTDEHFGTAVAVSGDIAYVGADGRDSQIGGIDVFQRASGVWTRTSSITPLTPTQYAFFPQVLAASGTTVVAAHRPRPPAASAERPRSTTRPAASSSDFLPHADSSNGDQFGAAVAASGDTVAIGAPSNDAAGSKSGAVYMYVLSGTAWTLQQNQRVGSDRTGAWRGSRRRHAGGDRWRDAPRLPAHRDHLERSGGPGGEQRQRLGHRGLAGARLAIVGGPAPRPVAAARRRSSAPARAAGRRSPCLPATRRPTATPSAPASARRRACSQSVQSATIRTATRATRTSTTCCSIRAPPATPTASAEPGIAPTAYAATQPATASARRVSPRSARASWTGRAVRSQTATTSRRRAAVRSPDTARPAAASRRGPRGRRAASPTSAAPDTAWTACAATRPAMARARRAARR